MHINTEDDNKKDPKADPFQPAEERQSQGGVEGITGKFKLNLLETKLNKIFTVWLLF